MQLEIAPDLQALANRFMAEGHGIRFVGGCVRDALLGQPPKDFDLATTATPDQQIALARRHGLRHLELGLEHGTVGFVLASGVYEITTLRRERNHDGRHADCEWTTDWTADAGRRDLRINAMSVDFQGRLHDPFNGLQDLRERRVRFVGDAAERITEDRLRGLRFLRFHGRFAGDAPLDPEGEKALRAQGKDLAGLSAERVREEMSKIVTGPHPERMLAHVVRLGLAPHIGLPATRDDRLAAAIASGVRDPHDRFAAYLGYDAAALADLGERWKLSTEARQRAAFVAQNLRAEDATASEVRYKRHLTLGRAPLAQVSALALAEGHPAVRDRIAAWPVPKCPVNGNDLVRLGYTPGPALGRQMKAVAEAWCQADYRLGREQLLGAVPALARSTRAGSAFER